MIAATGLLFLDEETAFWQVSFCAQTSILLKFMHVAV